MLQNPSACLNPVLSAGRQIAEIYRYHEGMGKRKLKKAGEMLELVGISSLRKDDYPHQFSGGMLQSYGCDRSCPEARTPDRR